VEKTAVGIGNFEMNTLRVAEKWEQAGIPRGQARAMVNALAEEMRDEIATKEFVRAAWLTSATRCSRHTWPLSSGSLC
jgi:hypothetical protein